MKILVLGGSGMLGASLLPALVAAGHAVSGHHRTAGPAAADLADAGATHALIARLRPDVTIDLAGLTDVDLCDREPQQAWLANVRTVEHVAAACRLAGSHMVLVSTDQVYDGPGPCPEELARPGNTYALTKYAGELAAQAVGATVLRTNFFGASRHPTRRSLTDWLHGALREERPIRVFDDVQFSPLSLPTLCSLLERLSALRPAGVFNLGSRDGMSKADFAFAFAHALNLPLHAMQRASVRQATLGAWRPSDMRMDSAKMESVLGMRLPRLGDEIELAAKDYRADL
jgi:dTDP-4-dehydrorhamnose reductase